MVEDVPRRRGRPGAHVAPVRPGRGRNPAPKEPEDGEPGAYIAVLSPNNAIHLGLSAKPAECRTLARALLGLRRDETISEADVV